MTSTPSGFGTKIKVLALDPLPKTAYDAFLTAHYEVDEVSEEFNETQLVKKVSEYNIVCLAKERDQIYLTDEVLKSAHRLLAVSVFARSASQVDMETANSMAELVISFLVLLARKTGDRSREIHQGVWNKKSDGCHEVRGKTLGIVGYGHIGSQIGVLAEALSLKVIYYDAITVMPIGRATSKDTLNELLAEADFIALNVSDTSDNVKMISAPQIALMKDKSFLINTSFGDAVDLDAVMDALKSGRLAGAAFDALPQSGTKGVFNHPIKDCDNVILLPGISDQTLESRDRAGTEVSHAVMKYLADGSTVGSVNFPSVLAWPIRPNTRRIINIHRNVRGFLKEIDYILSAYNVGKQVLDTKDKMGYLIADIATENVTSEIVAQLAILSNTVRTRIL